MTPFPLYMHDLFNYPLAMALATLLGLGFGFVLERAGFGRASVLVAQFYGDDNRVLKVMFTGIATAAVGLGLFSGLGLLDISAVQIPGTWLGPQILGGLVLGVGFAIAGYCPGTALVAAGSGHRDGWYALAGTMIGAVIFAIFWPDLQSFYESGGMGQVTLPALLGLSWPTVSIAVVVIAGLAFLGAEALERWLHARAGTELPGHHAPTRNGALGGLGAAAVIGLVVPALPRTPQAQESRKIDAISAEAVGERIVADPSSLWLVDLRSPAECAHARVPGARCLDDKDAAFIADLPTTRPMVLYGAGDLSALPDSAERWGGQVLVMTGGYSAFDAQVLHAPTAPELASREAVAHYEHLAALSGQLTGATTVAATVVAQPTAVKRASKKGGGC